MYRDYARTTKVAMLNLRPLQPLNVLVFATSLERFSWTLDLTVLPSALAWTHTNIVSRAVKVTLLPLGWCRDGLTSGLDLHRVAVQWLTMTAFQLYEKFFLSMQPIYKAGTHTDTSSGEKKLVSFPTKSEGLTRL